jgi:hypothetical protein
MKVGHIAGVSAGGGFNNAMARVFSWKNSADKYADLYRKVAS